MTTLATSAATLDTQKGGECWKINYCRQCCPIISHCCIMNVSCMFPVLCCIASRDRRPLVISDVEAASLKSCWWLKGIFACEVAWNTSVPRSDNIKHNYRKVWEYSYVSYVKHVKLVVISSCLTISCVRWVPLFWIRWYCLDC